MSCVTTVGTWARVCLSVYVVRKCVCVCVFPQLHYKLLKGRHVISTSPPCCPPMSFTPSVLTKASQMSKSSKSPDFPLGPLVRGATKTCSMNSNMRRKDGFSTKMSRGVVTGNYSGKVKTQKQCKNTSREYFIQLLKKLISSRQELFNLAAPIVPASLSKALEVPNSSSEQTSR